MPTVTYNTRQKIFLLGQKIYNNIYNYFTLIFGFKYQLLQCRILYQFCKKYILEDLQDLFLVSYDSFWNFLIFEIKYWNPRMQRCFLRLCFLCHWYIQIHIKQLQICIFCMMPIMIFNCCGVLWRTSPAWHNKCVTTIVWCYNQCLAAEKQCVAWIMLESPPHC